MRKISFLIFVFFLTSSFWMRVSGQSPAIDNFRSLQSYGQIPEDFLNSFRVSDPTTTEGKILVKSRKNSQGSEKFKVRSDYYMNELLTGGDVVFGDPIGAYVNKVADTLLATQPELRKQLRFYVTKSVAANAYASDAGIIFINIGLIARIKNEAQLAYILSHEIVHYVKQHNITIFLEEEKAYSRRNKNTEYQDLSVSEKLMRVNYRSKEIETIADHDGLAKYFANSPYDVNEVEGVFDVLLYSAYPFTNEPFNLSLFETKNMILPDYYLVDDVDKLKVDENEADSMSTHPNVRKRKEVIRALIDSIPEFGTQKFIHSQYEFNDVVAMARFEVLRQLIIDHQLIEALYCGASLLQEFPNNLFVKKCIAASLYGISAYKSKGETSDIMESYRNVDGEMAQVNFMVGKLNSRDLNIIALNYVWRLNNQFPGDEYIQSICDDLFHQLISENNVKQSFFYSKSLAQLRLEQAQQPAIPDTVVSTTRYRKKKATTVQKIDTTFTKFAFVDLLQDSSFVQDFHKWEQKNEDEKKIIEEAQNHSGPFPVHKTNEVKRKDRVPITRVVMSEPYTIKVDTRKRNQVKYQESVVSAARVKNMIMETSQMAGITVQLVDAVGLNADNVEEYNQMSYVNEYVVERFNQSEEGMLNSFCKSYIDTLMQKNQTKYLGWMGIASVQKKKPIGKLVIMSILPYLWPYTIYQFIVPKIHSTYYYVLFNVNTGKIVTAGATETRTDLHTDQMNSHIYDFMYKIKKTYEK